MVYWTSIYSCIDSLIDTLLSCSLFVYVLWKFLNYLRIADTMIITLYPDVSACNHTSFGNKHVLLCNWSHSRNLALTQHCYLKCSLYSKFLQLFKQVLYTFYPTPAKFMIGSRTTRCSRLLYLFKSTMLCHPFTSTPHIFEESRQIVF